MEDNEQNERSFSQSMWEDFSTHMDSSSLGEMQRIAAEVGIDEEMEVESEENSNMNEAVTEEANYGNEVVMAEVTPNTTRVNEVVIDEVTSRNEEKASVCSEENESLEDKKSFIKMRNFLSCEKYFLVLDLIRAVKEEFRNKDEEDSSKQTQSRPSPRGTYFSKEFGNYEFLDIRCEEKKIISLIEESIPDDRICVFETIKERFIEKYKPKSYTKRGFVNFCAVIAYLGIHCSTTGLDPSGKIKATNYICCLLYEVLQRGTLEQSSWGRSYFEFE